MQISFDPMIHAEAQAVRKMLDGLTSETVTVRVSAPVAQAVAADPDGAAQAIQSAAPLAPPVPSTADAAPATSAPAVFEGFAATSASAPSAPSAPESAAPSVPAAPTSPAGDVDSAGLPWDGRIHSESRAKVADGTWRKRRNTAPEVVAQVEAELRGQGAIPLAPTPAPSAPTAPATAIPATPVQAPVASGSDVPFVPATSAVPTAPTPTPPVAPVAPTAPAGTAPITFSAVLIEVNEMLNTSKTIANAQLDAALGTVGIPAGSFVALAQPQNVDKLEPFMTALRALAQPQNVDKLEPFMTALRALARV